MRDKDVQREIDRRDRRDEDVRPWRGVSEREIPDIYVGDVAFLHGVKWAEAKLKERNHG
jgi:hypothetical protein